MGALAVHVGQGTFVLPEEGSQLFNTFPVVLVDVVKRNLVDQRKVEEPRQ